MTFNCNDLWRSIPAVKILEGSTLPKDLFRISFADFLHIGAEVSPNNLSNQHCRLEKIFNVDFFDAYLFVTDEISVRNLKEVSFYEPATKNGNGFIYIYTYADSIKANKISKEVFLFWTRTCFEPKLKIGMTERHPFNRIRQQLSPIKTALPDLPILLAILWTNEVRRCEDDIHEQLKEKN